MKPAGDRPNQLNAKNNLWNHAISLHKHPMLLSYAHTHTFAHPAFTAVAAPNKATTHGSFVVNTPHPSKEVSPSMTVTEPLRRRPARPLWCAPPPFVPPKAADTDVLAAMVSLPSGLRARAPRT